METRTPRRRLFAHPATLALAAEGSSLRDVAEVAAVTQSCVSYQLAGRRPMTPSVHEAIVALIGQDGAERVVDAIPAPAQGRLAA